MINTFVFLLTFAVTIYVLTTAHKYNEKEKMQETTTQVVTNTDIHTLPTPVFILFAEYVGFVSDFLDWAEKWCNEGKISEWKKLVLKNDAANLIREINKHYSHEELMEWYFAIYDDFIKPNIDKYNKNNNS